MSLYQTLKAMLDFINLADLVEPLLGGSLCAVSRLIRDVEADVDALRDVEAASDISKCQKL